MWDVVKQDQIGHAKSLGQPVNITSDEFIEAMRTEFNNVLNTPHLLDMYASSLALAVPKPKAKPSPPRLRQGQVRLLQIDDVGALDEVNVAAVELATPGDHSGSAAVASSGQIAKPQSFGRILSFL